MSWNYDALIGFSNGTLKGIELKKNKLKYTNLLDAALRLNNLAYYDDYRTVISSPRKILIMDLNKKKISRTYNIQESGSIVGVFRHENVLVIGVENGMVVTKPVKNVSDLNPQKVNTGSNISCMKQVLKLNKFATGGNENPMKIWDLETGKIEFTAKRPKPDMLQLKQPTYVSDIRFFNNNKAVVSHRHGVVDLHDPISSQRRPVASCKAENTGFVSLTTIPDYNDYEVIVGTSKGSILHYDFRGKTTLPVKTFRGATGSVKSVSCITHLNQMHVMSISLDCHVRIHNFSSGDLFIQDYIVAKPSGLLTKLDDTEI